MFMGSEQVKGELVYDTGSSWLTFAAVGCKGCHTGIYNSTASNTSQSDGKDPFTITVIYLNINNIQYGSAVLTGLKYKDKACIAANDICVNTFEFQAITKAENLNGIDGILGIAPIDSPSNPSYVTALRNTGAIDNR